MTHTKVRSTLNESMNKWMNQWMNELTGRVGVRSSGWKHLFGARRECVASPLWWTSPTPRWYRRNSLHWCGDGDGDGDGPELLTERPLDGNCSNQITGWMILCLIFFGFFNWCVCILFIIIIFFFSPSTFRNWIRKWTGWKNLTLDLWFHCDLLPSAVDWNSETNNQGPELNTGGRWLAAQCCYIVD